MHEFEKNNGFKYDVVMRGRTDIIFNKKINVQRILDDYKGDLDKSVFIFGGWPDPKGVSRSRIGFFDGFAIGVPKVMDIYADVYHVKKIYENGGHQDDKENPGNQLEQYLVEKGLNIVYIYGRTSKRDRIYKIIR